MTKIQKIWLGISAAMFLVPEVFFSFSFLSIANLFGKDFSPLYTFFIDQQFFVDYPAYLFLALVIEWLGVLALLVLSIKCNNKKFIIVLLSILLLWLSFVLYVGYVISISMSFP